MIKFKGMRGIVHESRPDYSTSGSICGFVCNAYYVKFKNEVREGPFYEKELDFAKPTTIKEMLEK